MIRYNLEQLDKYRAELILLKKGGELNEKGNSNRSFTYVYLCSYVSDIRSREEGSSCKG
ncbi:hypothetical protein NBG4_260008 [Candidatus Sulfobium mesophilum]|uniref:Uncharacterized protein n=1 Tax=Candidatus Sulfobium mesophilum TaxID=2016548 RepID=A0A2U3QGI4_9BACT|nr:hypothetical protein NBG4_260008 [Candidatus Sulfobium mesophilum]